MLPESLRVALYARCSTIEQHPEMQMAELREYALRRGWQVAGEYVDAGISGARESRPQLNRLMADAKRRSFEAVLVWKFDRFGRSLKHLVNALEEFNAIGISFVSLRDSVDLSTPQGKLLFGIIASMAEFERSLIRERVKAGVQHARNRGKRLGRPQRVVDAQKIATLRATGASWRDIAGQLGVSLGTVYRRAA